MIKQSCKRCGKVIEGYSEKHVETMMQQHMIRHENEKKEAQKK